MSPWPGAPKSASSPPINPPSQRFPFTLTDQSSMADVADAMRIAYNGLAVHEQAFANLPSQIATQATAAATTVIQNSESISSVTAGVSSFNNLTGAVLYFPGLGTVNSQLGQTAYSVQPSDAGAKIIVGAATPITITLGGVAAPWFAIFDNDSSATANLSPASGAVFGASNIPAGGFGIVYFDGTNWWCGATGSSGGAAPIGGPTSGRPGSPIDFEYYYDTTLGLPVWWDGGQWTNAAGIPA